MAKQDKFGKLCKEGMITEIMDRFKKHPNFFITSYMGSSVADLELLRKSLRKAAGQYVVVKNSSLKVVFDSMKMEGLAAHIDGGMGISFAGDDIVATCKTLVTFAKDHTKFAVKAGMVEGKEIGPDKIRQLASLPPKQVLLAQVVTGMKSPITGFVMTLGGVIRKFVYVVDAIKNSKPAQQATAASAPTGANA